MVNCDYKKQVDCVSVLNIFQLSADNVPTVDCTCGRTPTVVHL